MRLQKAHGQNMFMIPIVTRSKRGATRSSSSRFRAAGRGHIPAANAGQPGRLLHGLGQPAEATLPLTYRDHRLLLGIISSEECPMPIYEYQCKACCNCFEHLVISASEQRTLSRMP
jgi:hypothetical protein